MGAYVRLFDEASDGANLPKGLEIIPPVLQCMQESLYENCHHQAAMMLGLARMSGVLHAPASLQVF